MRPKRKRPSGLPRRRRRSIATRFESSRDRFSGQDAPPPPRWLTRVVIDAIQSDQIREHGGLPGLRDENALESALARPQQKWELRRESPDVASLAAAYGFGLVRNHPFRDGNKRIGFLAMVTFLGINGYDFQTRPTSRSSPRSSRLPTGALSEDQLAD